MKEEELSIFYQLSRLIIDAFHNILFDAEGQNATKVCQKVNPASVSTFEKNWYSFSCFYPWQPFFTPSPWQPSNTPSPWQPSNTDSTQLQPGLLSRSSCPRCRCISGDLPYTLPKVFFNVSVWLFISVSLSCCLSVYCCASFTQILLIISVENY